MIIKLLAMKNAYVKDERGATAIEYGLIAGGISLAIALAVFLLGDSLETMFGSLSTALDSAASEIETR
jgi:pilus assembly protein Flp/PilA